jgi:integration host factor subunit beta
MTKSELVEILAERADIPKKRAEESVACVFDSLAEALSTGGRIEIRGFGSFALKEHSAYTGRNPRTGSEVPVAPKHSIHFKVGKELREMVDALPDPK